MKTQKKTFYVALAIFTVIFLLLGLIVNYIALPALNLRGGGLWLFILFLSLIITLIALIADYFAYDVDTVIYFKNISLIISAVIIIGYIIALFSSSPIINARKMASIISIEDGDFEKDMPETESVENIALMDTSTAEVFGNRALSDLAKYNEESHYELGDFSQINYKGKPIKIAITKYTSFAGWMKYHNEGITGYVTIDPVGKEGKYHRFKNPVKYSPYEKFGRNLKRTLRRRYPSYIFGEDIYFEIDEEDNPYYVAPVMKANAGVFGCQTVKGAVIINASTGESNEYSLTDVPEWVDTLFNGDYVRTRYNWKGMYSNPDNPFLNSLFAKDGVTIATEDFGYVAKDTDIYIYTGITSASNDASNVGLLMVNGRTGEFKKYNIGGADEASAMEAAEGAVSNYGYYASFPSVISVNGIPTYITMLKDQNSIVKGFALVNVENYSKVVTGDTQEEVFKKYLQMMGLEDENTNIDQDKLDNNDTSVQEFTKEKEIKVIDIQYIVQGGNTTVYIESEDEKIYSFNFDENLLFIKKGDIINVMVEETNNKIIRAKLK